MGKPIAGYDMYPFGKNGYKATMKNSEGKLIKNLYIIKQRSVNQFDLSDGTTVYKYVTLSGHDGSSKSLPNNTFFVKYEDKGYIVRFLLNKVILNTGETFFVNHQSI